MRRSGKDPISLEEYLAQKGIDPAIDVNLPIYEAQSRLIPSDQIEEARIALMKRINKELNNLDNPQRAELAARYQDVYNKLTDHVESPNGARSMPLTQQESKVLQSLSKEGKFDPARYDITLARKADYMYLAHSTIHAGLNSALYGAVFKAVPSLVKAITSLVKDGKITREQLEDLCRNGGSGAVQGFLQGFSSAFIKNSCALGWFGEELQAAALLDNAQFNNAAIVIATAAVETLKDSVKLYQGEMNQRVFAQRLDRRAFITSFSYLGGVTLQGAMPCAPVIGYMLGCCLGSVLGGFVFEAKEKAFMSICVESGFTFFGLVEQDYELPAEVKEYLGMESMYFEKMDLEEMDYEEVIPETMQAEVMNFESMDVKWARRGVVGIRKVGYVLC